MFIHYGPFPARPWTPPCASELQRGCRAPALEHSPSPPPSHSPITPKICFSLWQIPTVPSKKSFTGDAFCQACWDPLAPTAFSLPQSWFFFSFFPSPDNQSTGTAPWLEPERRAAPFGVEHICSQGWRGALERGWCWEGGRGLCSGTGGHGSLLCYFKGNPVPDLPEELLGA